MQIFRIFWKILLAVVLTASASCSCSKGFDIVNTDEELIPITREHDAPYDQVEITDRKIIKTGTIGFETKDLNKTKSLIVHAVQELNGYIAIEDALVNEDGFISNYLKIRVPADNFDLLVNKISESGSKLIRKRIDLSDVTEEYIDVETRINTKKAIKSRYLELLKQATKVDEILNIEREIGKLQIEIERVERRMRYLNSQIAYSTIWVDYYQETTSKFDFFSKLSDGFKKGWDVFKWLIIGLSHLWVFILVAFVSVCLIKLWKKKNILINNEINQK